LSNGIILLKKKKGLVRIGGYHRNHHFLLHLLHKECTCITGVHE